MTGFWVGVVIGAGGMLIVLALSLLVFVQYEVNR